MTSAQLTAAIVAAFLRGGEGFVEGTLSATLPIVWVLALVLHLARPYVLGTTRALALRLAADVWWVLYVAARDLLVVVAFVMSFMFFFPDVLVEAELPIGGSLATALLCGVLLTKLVADPDEDERAFRVVSALLFVGAALYIVPTLAGVQAGALRLGAPWDGLASTLVTSRNPTLAIALWGVSIAATSAMGLVAVWLNVRPARTGSAR